MHCYVYLTLFTLWHNTLHKFYCSSAVSTVQLYQQHTKIETIQRYQSTVFRTRRVMHEIRLYIFTPVFFFL
jgi:hypothetical protein